MSCEIVCTLRLENDPRDYGSNDIRESSRKLFPFLHRLINRAGIRAHNTATHVQLIGHSMLDVSRLNALQLFSRQRYLSRSGPFFVAFWRFISQPIKLQHFVKFCNAVIAHIAFNAYLTNYLLLYYANFQRLISNGWCSKSKWITLLSKGKIFNFYVPIACFGMSIC